MSIDSIAHEVTAVRKKIFEDKQPRIYLGRNPLDDYLGRAVFLPEPTRKTTPSLGSASLNLSNKLDYQSGASALLARLRSTPSFYQNEGPAGNYKPSGSNAGYSSGNQNSGYSCSGCYQ